MTATPPVSGDGAPSLDLAREELRDLGRAVLHAAGDPTEPFGVYAFAADDPASELARSIERTVFHEWFGNSPELLDGEYRAFEPDTAFLCVMDQRRALPAGMLRLILPQAAGFKSLLDIGVAWERPAADVLRDTGIAMDPDRTWDITTIAVAPDYRRGATQGLVSLALYQAVCQASLACDIRWWVTILDLVVLDLINTVTSGPFLRYSGLEPLCYLDSPSSLPVYCDLEEYFPRLALTDASMYEILHAGIGLEAAVRAPDWSRTPLAAHAPRGALLV